METRKLAQSLVDYILPIFEKSKTEKTRVQNLADPKSKKLMAFWGKVSLLLTPEDHVLIKRIIAQPNNEFLLKSFTYRLEEKLTQDPRLKNATIFFLNDLELTPDEEQPGSPDKAQDHKQNSDINIEGEYAAGRDIFVRKALNVRLLIVGGLLLVAIVLGYFSRNEIGQYFKNMKKFSQEDASLLRIAILPFHSDIDLKDVDVDFRGQLIERLEKKRIDDSLHIKMLVYDGIQVPKTVEEARNFGLKKNADLIIWGNVEETNQGPGQLRLRYAMSPQFGINKRVDESLQKGDTKMQKIKTLGEVREGYLQQDVDYLIHWVEGMSAIERSDFKAAKEQFEQIIPDTLVNEAYAFDTYHRLGRIYINLENHQKAAYILEKVLGLREQYVDDNPGLLIRTYYNLAGAYWKLGNIELARSYADKAIETGLETLKRDSSDVIQIDVSTAYNIQGTIDNSEGKYESALYNFKKNLQWNEEVLGKDYPELGLIHLQISQVQNRLVMYKEAMASLKRAVELLEPAVSSSESVTGNPINDSVLKPNLATVYNDLGTLLQIKGDFQQALENKKKAIKIYEDVYPEESIFLALMNSFIGILYLDLGQYDKSLEHCKKSVKYIDILSQNWSPAYLAGLHQGLGRAYAANQKYDSALESFQNAKNDYAAVDRLEGVGNGMNMVYKAEVLIETEKYQTALSLINNAKNIIENKTKEHDPVRATMYHVGAKLHYALRNYVESSKYSELAIAVMTKNHPDGHPHLKKYVDLLVESKKEMSPQELAKAGF